MVSSFVIANLVVLVLTFVVFFLLDSLKDEIDKLYTETELFFPIVKIQTSVDAIKEYKQKLRAHERVSDSNIIDICTDLIDQLNELEKKDLTSLTSREEDKKQFKEFVGKMIEHVGDLKVASSKAPQQGRDKQGQISGISESIDEILNASSELQKFLYETTERKVEKIKATIGHIKSSMMYTLIIGFLGTIILAWVVPGKITRPFRKIRESIRELQDCNLDVSIDYSQKDEIGEIAHEMNKMIKSFKVFDELRTDRISMENRKFDALANLVKRPVLLANADSKIIYMNNRLYSLLRVQSEDIIGKEMSDVIVPKSIIECYDLAIKRRSKIENAEVVIHARKIDSGDGGNGPDGDKDSSSLEGGGGGGEVAADPQEIIFKGHANVIPIHGKNPSLDYYLMVLSTTPFT